MDVLAGEKTGIRLSYIDNYFSEVDGLVEDSYQTHLPRIVLHYLGPPHKPNFKEW